MTHRLRRPAGALLAGVLTAGILGVAPPAHAAGGTISGTVTGADGAALANVGVKPFVLADGYWQFADEYTSTDAAGAYTLQLAAEDYRLAFYAPGSHVTEYYDNAEDVEDGVTLTLTEGDVETANAELAVASHVTGTITGPDGLPLVDVDVDAYEEVTDENGNPYFQHAGSGGTSLADGSYDVGGLAAGSYRLQFKAYDDTGLAYEFYDDQPSLEGAQDVSVAASTAETTAVLQDIDAQLAMASQISGLVTDAAGAPMGGVEVYSYVKAGDEWVYAVDTTTAADGTYTVDGLPKGTYRIGFEKRVGDDYLHEAWNNKARFDQADDIVVGSDENVGGKDAQLIVGEHDPKYVEVVTEPTIGGTPLVGNTLTAGGTWNPSDVTVAYQWFRGEELVAGATGATYTLTAADQGQHMWVEVVASYPGYGSWHGWATVGPVAAAPVPAVVVAPTPAPAPVIDFPRSMDVKGSMTVGSTIRLKNYQALVSRTTTTYKFQWFKGTKKIKKATRSKLKLTRALKGKKISVKVTAKVGTTTKTVRIKAGRVR